MVLKIWIIAPELRLTDLCSRYEETVIAENRESFLYKKQALVLFMLSNSHAYGFISSLSWIL